MLNFVYYLREECFSFIKYFSLGIGLYCLVHPGASLTSGAGGMIQYVQTRKYSFESSQKLPKYAGDSAKHVMLHSCDVVSRW